MAYTVPTAADLKARYAAFADVDAGVIEYWITDAQRFVNETWIEADYAPALMALAAHNLSLAGYGADAEAMSGVPSGITRFRSGSLDVSFTEQAANSRAAGNYDSTRYGAEFKLLQRRSFAGPVISSTGTVPYDPATRYPQGEA